MIPTMINTHKAYKALQNAGVADKQAEVMVEIFAEMQQENALTKSDLSQALEGVVRAQNASNHRLEKLEGSFEHFKIEVKSQFQAVDARLNHVDMRFDKIDKRFEKVNEQFDKIDKRFEKIDEKFEKIDGEFKRIDGEFKRMDGEFKKVDERFTRLENRMEVGFNELKGEMIWLRRILMGATTAIFLSAFKFLFTS